MDFALHSEREDGCRNGISDIQKLMLIVTRQSSRKQKTSRLQASGKKESDAKVKRSVRMQILTIDLQHGVQEAVSFVLQSIVGSQWHREVTVGLSITYEHLDFCEEQRMHMFSQSELQYLM